jgi:hypothetical protein
MMNMRKLLLLLLCSLSVWSLQAQDVSCKVDVSFDRIQNVDPKVFQTLKRALNDFINNRKWTNDNFNPTEKIECSFLLNLTSRSNDNVYDATLNIQASRPVYNSGYYTPTVNYIDRDIKFRYDESQNIQFDDNRVAGSDALVANLPAILAYYVYLIVALDYESFSPNGGEEYFKKALNVVNNAPEEGKLIKGWKVNEGTRNRYWIIEQLLNPRYDKFRPYWYAYHRKGLDVMSQNPDEGRKVILDGIPVLTKINDANPSSILFQFFFNAKSNEFFNTLSQTKPEDRKDYIEQLSKMDVPNSARYRGIK